MLQKLTEFSTVLGCVVVSGKLTLNGFSIIGFISREINTDYVMNNNFAFGGVNTSLIFKCWRDEK